jgi:5-methylcytosine-specific restriction protein A
VWCGLARRTFGTDTVDHIEPHGHDINRFWLGKLQSLCVDCHNVGKQFQEHRGFTKDIGPDGFPIDPNHPAYARERSK